MYQHILLAVALQQWDEFSPYTVAAREAAVALANWSGAQLSVLSVYDYDDETPGSAEPLFRGAGSLSGHPDGAHG
jgi:nucleotide-binding universal stress UspA family protein